MTSRSVHHILLEPGDETHMLVTHYAYHGDTRAYTVLEVRVNGKCAHELICYGPLEMVEQFEKDIKNAVTELGPIDLDPPEQIPAAVAAPSTSNANWWQV